MKPWTLATLAILLAGCADDGPPSPVAAVVMQRERTFVYEKDFVATPALAARKKQTIVLDLEPATAQAALVENVSRHWLDEGSHRFCLQQDDPYLRSLVIEDDVGVARATADASSRCATVALPSGAYRMRVRHDATGFGDAHRVAFVQSGNVDVPLVDANGQPVGGWWAMRPDATADPQRRLGRVAAPPPVVNINNGSNPEVQKVIADFAHKQIDGDALFNFRPALGSYDPSNGNRPRVFTGNHFLNVTYASLPAYLVADLTGYNFLNPINIWPLTLANIGNNVGYFGQGFFGGDGTSPFYLDAQFNWAWQSAYYPPPAVFTLLFRFFPDGQIEPLRQGEVALFQQCNYGGKATVFAIDSSSFVELDSSVITLDKTTASIRLGNDTAVTLYPDTEFGGTPQVVEADTPCLDGTPIGRGARSIQVAPLTSVYLVSSQQCINCQLVGVDLSNADLSGTNLQGANLSGATLAKTKLHNAANLTNTNFTGAKLFCTDFSGTDDTHRVDLTQTMFGGAQYTTDYSCRASFAWTRIAPQVLTPSVWRYLDLSNALVTGLKNNPLSTQAKPLDLSRVLWTGAQLPGAILDYATGLPNADLTNVVLSGGSLVHVDLGNTILNGTQLDGVTADDAILTGAVLQNANVKGIVLNGATGFVGANLSQVVLSGASLQGVDFTGANMAGTHLDGAKLQGAKLIRVTGLASATLTGMDLTGGSLAGTVLPGVSFQQATLDDVSGLDGPSGAGVDLSGTFFNNASAKRVNFANAKLYGANFTNANLEEVNLAGAFLTSNPGGTPPVPNPANFTGAHLKNANLTGAGLSSTIFTNASFYGSYNGNAPSFPCPTDTTKCGNLPAGKYTCSCATAVGATMADTRFDGAYLFGVDFGGSTTKINGVNFSGAVLVGANFSNASINLDPGQSSPPDFTFAYLQGALLGGTNLTSTSLSGAFVDFGASTNKNQGNILQILLGTALTGFKGWEAPNVPVCVQAPYGAYTTVPPDIPSMTCPDGNSVPASGCGPTEVTNTHWASKAPIGQASPPGFYQFDSTYVKADQTNACNAGTYNLDW